MKLMKFEIKINCGTVTTANFNDAKLYNAELILIVCGGERDRRGREKLITANGFHASITAARMR